MTKTEKLTEAMELIRDYCTEQGKCDNCIFFVKRFGCKIQTEPSDWESAEEQMLFDIKIGLADVLKGKISFDEVKDEHIQNALSDLTQTVYDEFERIIGDMK